MKKPKYNKNKCKSCIYHAKITGIASGTVFCNYASIAESTCLKRGGKGEVIDMRGGDRENCNLYEKGSKIRDNSNWQEHHRLWKGEDIDG